MAHPQTPSAGIGTTALGRLQLRVPGAAGPETVVKERRWGDLAAARAWCERSVAEAARGTEVLEIQVFEEAWWHARSWDPDRHRPVPEVLQLGVIDAAGHVLWGEPRSMSPQVADRI